MDKYNAEDAGTQTYISSDIDLNQVQDDWRMAVFDESSTSFPRAPRILGNAKNVRYLVVGTFFPLLLLLRCDICVELYEELIEIMRISET